MVHLIGRHKLTPLKNDGPVVRKWLANWVAEVTDAHWKRPSDVTSQFPTARLYQDGSFLFPITNHEAGIRLLISYSQNVALITALQTSKTANER
jgi:mRNA-degrading endonuclease HigB of HigAB toxin-antitoxin module